MNLQRKVEAGPAFLMLFLFLAGICLGTSATMVAMSARCQKDRVECLTGTGTLDTGQPAHDGSPQYLVRANDGQITWLGPMDPGVKVIRPDLGTVGQGEDLVRQYLGDQVQWAARIRVGLGLTKPAGTAWLSMVLKGEVR